MYRFTITALAVFISLSIYCQKDSSRVALRIQNNYFLTGQPVFGLGIEYQIQSGQSVLFGLEYGKYASETKNLISANLETYSLKGFAIQSAYRRYFGQRKDQYGGVFGEAAICHQWLGEHESEGVSVTREGGLNLDGSSHANRRVLAGMATTAIGYRLGCSESKIMVEASTGLGYLKIFSPTDGSAKIKDGLRPRFEMAILIQL